MADLKKISVNKLGEYITANPSRRKKIIADQKKPKPFIFNRYSKAKTAIINYFVHKKGDADEIRRFIESLIYQKHQSDFQKEDNILSIEALEIFLDNRPFGEELLEFDFEKYEQFESQRMNISGISVSVRPEVVISGKLRGKPFKGGIKIHISKNHVLDNSSGVYSATVLYEYLKSKYPNENVKHDFCICLDIFSSTMIKAPKNNKRKWMEIQDACEEIKIRWDYV